jgi:hypothetical protein
MATPASQGPTRDSHGGDPRGLGATVVLPARSTRQPRATSNGLDWVVTANAVTFGGRRRLIWASAEELSQWLTPKSTA